MVKPDGKGIEFKVDEHDVPYLMEYRETIAVPAGIEPNRRVLKPAATPASPPAEDPEETGQGGPWLAEDDRAAKESKTKSIHKPAGEPVGPPSRNPFEQVAEPIETDYSEADAEEEQDLRRRGDKAFLIEDVNSLAHLCTHLPTNPYCTSCVRAKVNQKRKRRQGHKKHTIDAEKFGDSVTGDHLVSNGVQSNGIDGEAVGFLLRDHATRFKQLNPAAIKTAKECAIALYRFQGSQMSNIITHLYADGAPEIVKAGRNLRICHDTSTPYRSAINGLAEREIRNVLEGTRTLLEHSGLPTSYGPYASRCFCHHANIRMVEGDSAWNKRHKQGHFKGDVIPFGALIGFRPLKSS